MTAVLDCYTGFFGVYYKTQTLCAKTVALLVRPDWDTWDFKAGCRLINPHKTYDVYGDLYD